MAFGSFDNKSAHQPMNEINMVPLIDVMLVLLVIFIVTAPLLTNSVKIDLPKASAAVNAGPVDKIEFAIDRSGGLFWNGETVTRPVAAERFIAAAQQQPQPELHLRADRQTPYESVAQVMADAAKAGLGKIGFITEPEARQ